MDLVRNRASLVVDRTGLDALIRVLRTEGRTIIGPVLRDRAIVPGALDTTDDLPEGWHDEQAPGRYHVRHSDSGDLFGWAVGPGSWKSAFFPARSLVWTATQHADDPVVTEAPIDAPPVAIFGARPCEVAATAVLDRVLGGGAIADPAYRARRDAALVLVAECGAPANTCFCTSMGTGPGAGGTFDIALTELPGPQGWRYLLRSGSDRGDVMLRQVTGVPASAEMLDQRDDVLSAAASRMSRAMSASSVPSLLARNLKNPRWEEVASRCLSCGNCTMVCPTCYCSAVEDTTTIDGTVERHRRWDTCFGLGHSLLHSGPVRPTVRSRYRQWLTHKLSTWHDQFGMSGCVGCGRCIAWCPVGIDLTEEVAAIAASDGAVPVGIEKTRARS